VGAVSSGSGRGLASIIMPGLAPSARVRRTVAALVRHTRPPWELIVVAGRAPNGPAEYWSGVRDAAPVRVEVVAAHGPPDPFAAFRDGVGAARGDLLVLLDSHAVVTDAWLDQLASLVGAGPAIGMAAPLSDAAPPPQRVEGPPPGGPEEMRRFAASWRAAHRGRWFTAATLAGPCVLITRRALEAAGPAGSLEDLCRRVRDAGYELAVARDLVVFGGSLPAPVDDGGRAAPAVAPRRVRISLTMIVRDEQENLPACLESARGLFDEVIVVDTGSADRTKEVARSLGARVFDFAWCDDFAAARNAALGHATGDYAFWLDADDRVDPPQRDRLRALFDGLGGGGGAAYVLRCLCEADRDGRGETVVDHIRLFPLRDDVRWSYRVHEQILPALRRAKVEVRRADAVIRHVGYRDPVLRSRKLDRDVRLLEAELRERPGDPFVLFNLGWVAMERKDPRTALGYLRASLAGSAPTDSITRKLHALIAQAHQALGDTAAALAACAAGLAAAPGDAELLFREAVIRRVIGDRDGAEARWREVLGRGGSAGQFSSVVAGLSGHLTRRNLAALVEERGDRAEAARLWREVLAECPGDRDAVAALGRLARAIEAPPRPHDDPAAGGS
jgi:GT2 family glycosyltransferase